jgi:hypothetical protein
MKAVRVRRRARLRRCLMLSRRFAAGLVLVALAAGGAAARTLPSGIAVMGTPPHPVLGFTPAASPLPRPAPTLTAAVPPAAMATAASSAPDSLAPAPAARAAAAPGASRHAGLITADDLARIGMLPAQQQQKAQKKQQSAGPPQPTLQQLGITPQMTQANVKAQQRLNRRQWMLRWHQRLGLITGGAMFATFFLGHSAGPHGTPTGRNIHAALGTATTALYFTTAYMALEAPKIPGTKPTGAVKLHEILAWIHFPGMILTPILGYMAYHQEQLGQRPHGIAKLHGLVATVTFLAFASSIVAVSWPIHLPFHL